MEKYFDLNVVQVMNITGNMDSKNFAHIQSECNMYNYIIMLNFGFLLHRY